MQENKKQIMRFIENMKYVPEKDWIFTDALERFTRLSKPDVLKAARALADDGILAEYHEYRCPSCMERLLVRKAGEESDDSFYCDRCDAEFNANTALKKVFFKRIA